MLEALLIISVISGTGLVALGFGTFITKAVDSGHYLRWGAAGLCAVLLGAGLAATGVTGLVAP